MIFIRGIKSIQWKNLPQFRHYDFIVKGLPQDHGFDYLVPSY